MLDPLPAAAPEPDVLDTGAAGGRAIRGGALRTGSYAGTLLLGLVSVPLMTRHLGVVDYGYYVTVTAVVFIIGGFTEAGLTNLGIRQYSAMDGEDRNRYMQAIAGLRLVLTSVGVLAAAAMTLALGRPTVVVLGTLIAGVGLLLGLVQQTYAIPLSAQLRFGWLSVIDLFKQLLLVGSIITCVVIGTGLEPFFWATVVSGGGSLLITLALIRREGVRSWPSVDTSRWRSMLHEIVPYALAAVAGIVYFRLGVVLLGLSASDEQVGIYSTAFRIIEVVSSLPFIVVSAAFPILARAARNDTDRLRYGVQRLFDGSALLGGLLTIGLVVGARFAIELIAPIDAFAGSVPVLRLQALSVPFTFVVATLSFALLSLERYRLILWSNVLALVVAAVGTPALAPALGATGAAISTAVAEAALATAYYVALRSASPDTAPRLRGTVKVLAAAGCAALVVLLGLPPIVEAAIAGVIYLMVCFALGAVPPELLRALLRRDPG